MTLGTDDRELPVQRQPADILKQIFPADEMRFIGRVVRLERSRELVDDLMAQAKARGDLDAQGLLAELRLNLRVDLAEANRAYVEEGLSPQHAVPSRPVRTQSTLQNMLKGVFKWMR